MLPKNTELQTEHRDYLLNGVTVLTGKAFGLYSDGKIATQREQDFIAIPYYAWAHRGQGEMAVWLPYEEAAAKVLSFSNVK